MEVIWTAGLNVEWSRERAGESGLNTTIHPVRRGNHDNGGRDFCSRERSWKIKTKEERKITKRVSILRTVFLSFPLYCASVLCVCVWCVSVCVNPVDAREERVEEFVWFFREFSCLVHEAAIPCWAAAGSLSALPATNVCELTSDEK